MQKERKKKTNSNRKNETDKKKKVNELKRMCVAEEKVKDELK